MNFREIYEQNKKLNYNRYLFCSGLERLIQDEVHDFDARVYINLDKVLIKTNLKLTVDVISKILTDYDLELDCIRTIILDNLISQVETYEYTFGWVDHE